MVIKNKIEPKSTIIFYKRMKLVIRYFIFFRHRIFTSKLTNYYRKIFLLCLIQKLLTVDT